MEISDIFIEQSNKGFKVHTSSFIPNVDDKQLKIVLDQMVDSISGRARALTIISKSEFEHYRDDLADAISNDAECVRALADELMSLRKLTRTIQEERDTLAKFIAEEVLKGKSRKS